MSDDIRFEVVAKLPLLGPVIGWTRPDAGELKARLWIRVDDAESEPPVAALTALCGPDGRVREGSVAVWALARLIPPASAAPRGMHFAVADVVLPADAPDCVVRMVSLHRITLATGDGQRPRAVLDETNAPPLILQVREKGDHADDRMQQQLQQAGRADASEAYKLPLSEERLPAPWQIPEGLLPDLEGRLERLAEDAFRNVEESLALARQTASAPIPGTLSRKRLRVRTMDECEAAPSPLARAKLAGSAYEVTFAAGSCRHPGTGFERELSGRVLQALGATTRLPHGPAFALLTGDQIYADATAGVFDIETRFEKFAVRYERAFGADAFRSVASRIPLYMAADDHEIGDGWSLARVRAMNLSDAERRAHERTYAWGRTLFFAHQRLHGPTEPTAAHAWYSFEAAGLPFFVMDTRFERVAHAPDAAPRLLAEAQWTALEDWLDGLEAQEHLRTAPKFVVSGAVFAPGLTRYAEDAPAARSADNWQGFPADRARLARSIATRNIANVVFVSGDYHCAALAALDLFDGRGRAVQAYAIVSPPFFAPYPFANTRAHEICTREVIHDPSAATAGSPSIVGECRALAIEGQGFALIRVARNGADWAVDVEFRHPARNAAGELVPATHLAARLAHGKVTPKQPG